VETLADSIGTFISFPDAPMFSPFHHPAFTCKRYVHILTWPPVRLGIRPLLL